MGPLAKERCTHRDRPADLDGRSRDQCPFNHASGDIQPAGPGNHFLEEACSLTVARSLHDLLNQFPKSFRTQRLDLRELTDTMMGNSCSDPRLVKPNWDCNHGDTLAEGFEN